MVDTRLHQDHPLPPSAGGGASGDGCEVAAYFSRVVRESLIWPFTWIWFWRITLCYGKVPHSHLKGDWDRQDLAKLVALGCQGPSGLSRSAFVTPAWLMLCPLPLVCLFWFRSLLGLIAFSLVVPPPVISLSKKLCKKWLATISRLVILWRQIVQDPFPNH